MLDVSISAVSRVFYTTILQMDREIYFDDMLYSQINTTFFSNIDQDTYASLMWQSENFFAIRVQETCTIHYMYQYYITCINI